MSLYVEYYLQFVAAFIILTWALYVPFRAGQLYNGPVYCMAIGGYFAAYMVRDQGWPFALALIAAVIVGAIFGFIPALGFARTTGIATAMASMALIFIVQSVIRNLNFIGGSRGLWSIPSVDNLLIICYVTVLLVGIFVYRLDHSRLGRALESICIDANLSSVMGINVKWMNVFVLTLSSAMGALAGVLFSFTMGSIFPDSFGFSLLLYVWTMMYVGGRYTMWGALIAAPVLWGLPQWVPRQMAEYTNIGYGALLVLLLLLRPRGLIGRDVLQHIKSLRKPRKGSRPGTSLEPERPE